MGGGGWRLPCGVAKPAVSSIYIPDVPPVCLSPSWAPGGSLPSLKPLLLWTELKKVVAEQPRGLNTMREAFPVWEAASRWSQALEDVEESSHPFLEEVQRYERYRCLETCEVEGVDGSASQPPWAHFTALVSTPCTKSLPPFKPRPLTHWASTPPT